MRADVPWCGQRIPSTGHGIPSTRHGILSTGQRILWRFEGIATVRQGYSLGSPGNSLRARESIVPGRRYSPGGSGNTLELRGYCHVASKTFLEEARDRLGGRPLPPISVRDAAGLLAIDAGDDRVVSEEARAI